MLRLKKLIMLVLAAVILSMGAAGCKQKAEHPSKEAPSAEHPTDGNKPAEHPEHPK